MIPDAGSRIEAVTLLLGGAMRLTRGGLWIPLVMSALLASPAVAAD
jgi:hypothetical protein